MNKESKRKPNPAYKKCKGITYWLCVRTEAYKTINIGPKPRKIKDETNQVSTKRGKV